MKKIIVAVFLILSLTFSSCVSLALRYKGVFDEEVDELYYKNADGKELVFLPMIHIAIPEYYDDVKRSVDSLRKNSFYFGKETVRTNLSDSSLIKLNDLKIRKILNFHLGPFYLDTVNHKLMGKYRINKEIVNQPKYDFFGLDSLNSEVMDLPIENLITEFESKVEIIKLDSCDYNTPLASKYKCSYLGRKKRKYFIDSIALGYRNQYIAGRIMDSKRNKIALLFGGKHAEGLLEELKKIDSTWHEIK